MQLSRACPLGDNARIWADCRERHSTRAGQQTPKPVLSGLIHDWRGASFILNTTFDGVLFPIRDYGNYKVFISPHLLIRGRWALMATGANTQCALSTRKRWPRLRSTWNTRERRWYSVTHTKRVQENRHYGKANEQELPPNQGSGYIWRLYSIAGYEQRDGGTYVEVEAIALSRDIPVAVFAR